MNPLNKKKIIDHMSVKVIFLLFDKKNGAITLEHLLKLCGTSLPPKQHKIFLVWLFRDTVLFHGNSNETGLIDSLLTHLLRKNIHNIICIKLIKSVY